MLATQNPIEQEGTYPLPEAQLDRFMFLIELEYPSEAEEIQIARTTTGDALPQLDHLMTPAEIIRHQSLVRRVPVPDHIYSYAARLVRKTRPKRLDGAGVVQAAGLLGSRPAAVQYLILGAKARAALLGSYMVRLEDVQEAAAPRADAPHHHHVRRPGRRNRRQEDRSPADRGDEIRPNSAVLVVRVTWDEAA